MKARRVWANLKMQLVSFKREKTAVFFTILFPILMMVMFGFIFQDADETEVTIHVQDLDGTDLSKNLTQILGSPDNVHIVKIDDGADPEDYMKDNDINFLLIIPKGYQDAIYAKMSYDPNMTVNLTVMYDPSVSVTGIKLSFLNSAMNEINKGMVGAEDTILLEPESIVSDQYEYIEFFIPGLIGFTVMTTALFNTMTINTEFKQKGIIRKLSTTPITRSEWILSNIFYQVAVSTLSTIVMLTVGYLVFRAWLSLNIFLPLFIIIEVFAFGGLAMLVVGGIKDAQTAIAVSNVIMFPMMFLAGTFFPVESMPDFLQYIAKVMPLYYVNEGLREAMIFQDFGAAGGHMLVILVFAVIVFIGGIFLTSWKHD
jgi:ABC-2 type transport system permease protein